MIADSAHAFDLCQERFRHVFYCFLDMRFRSPPGAIAHLKACYYVSLRKLPLSAPFYARHSRHFICFSPLYAFSRTPTTRRMHLNNTDKRSCQLV